MGQGARLAMAVHDASRTLALSALLDSEPLGRMPLLPTSQMRGLSHKVTFLCAGWCWS